MTLATFNRYVDRVMDGSKTAPLSGKHGRTHAGAREKLIGPLTIQKKPQQLYCAPEHLLTQQKQFPPQKTSLSL